MKMSVKIITGVLLALLTFVPISKSFAYEKLADYGSQISEDSDSETLKRKKTDDAFFNLQIDKLSTKFFVRLLINIASIFILIRFIYYGNYKKRELFFPFFIFNFVIFLVSYLLNKVDMGMGAAFGLFAVFSMLRYRTENISTKDMTYLFLSIAIGLISSISKSSAAELVILNGLILLVTFLMEGNIFMKKEFSKSVQYENIDMISPENHPALILDLKKRTGLNIHRIAIDKVDFLKDTAKVSLYYYEDKKSAGSIQEASVRNTLNK